MQPPSTVSVRWTRRSQLLLEGILNFLAGLREVASHLVLLSVCFQFVVANGFAGRNLELALKIWARFMNFAFFVIAQPERRSR